MGAVNYWRYPDTVDRLEMSADILKSLVAYAPYQRKDGLLLRGSRKNGKLTNVGAVRGTGKSGE